jgi:hypothetical protein
VAPGIHAHSIIPTLQDGPLDTRNDGVVQYKSAHIDGVESEAVIEHSGHSTQSNPLTVREVRPHSARAPHEGMLARVRGTGANAGRRGRAQQGTATGAEEPGSCQPGYGIAALIQRRTLLRRMARWTGFALLAATALLIGTWCALAVWFRSAGGDLVRGALAAAIAVLAVATVTSFATSRRWFAFPVYAGVTAVVFAWWSTIRPSNDRDWQPDVARNATATIDNDQLVVHNVRNFNWRSDQDFDQRWEERSYDLSQLHDVDLVLSYWSGEAIAHLMLSFGFDDGPGVWISPLRRARYAERNTQRSPDSSSSMNW